MKKNSIAFIAGLVSCLTLIGVFGYLIVPNLMTPKAPSTDKSTGGLVFNQQALLSVRSKVVNGNLPIQVGPGDLGNPQLFK